MRLIFAGTPDAAVPALRALLASRHEVLAVVTRPDAPTGRGRRLTPSPVRVVAEEAGLPVLTPRSLRDADLQSHLRELAPDAAPVVAYGGLVPPAALEIPTHGWVNLHFSSLPRWRGAAPAQRAVLAGDPEAGLTTFRLDEGLDTGDVLLQETTVIGPTETAGELLERLADQGAELLVRTLDALEDGTAHPQPQPSEGASHAAKLTVDEAQIDWTRPAHEVSALIRGMSPQPGAWTLLDGARVKVLGVEATQTPDDLTLAPGRLHATKKALFVGTSTGPLALGTIAPAGKRPMRAADWARGAALPPDAGFEMTTDTAMTTDAMTTYSMTSAHAEEIR